MSTAWMLIFSSYINNSIVIVKLSTRKISNKKKKKSIFDLALFDYWYFFGWVLDKWLRYYGICIGTWIELNGSTHFQYLSNVHHWMTDKFVWLWLMWLFYVMILKIKRMHSVCLCNTFFDESFSMIIQQLSPQKNQILWEEC